MSTWLLPRLDLTPDQLRIVEIPPDKHRVVLGFPGSGKTQILIHRADYLSKTYHLSADRYRVFVFTNVIKEYIRSGIQFLGLPEESVSTFDHWCRIIYESRISRRLPRLGKSIDFDQIRTSVLYLFRKKQELQKTLDFVLVDEGQDLTAQAYEILNLAAQHITVFADPQQQIFDNGTSISVILEKLGLNNNNAALLGAYRNAPYVAQLASRFIEDAQKRSQYLLQVNKEQKVREHPLCYVAPNHEKEIDRLAEIVSQRQAMNEQIGIIVPTNRQVFGFAKGLEQRGVTVEKAAAGKDNSYDFSNSLPKIVTYFSAKGLTFDSVLLPRLTESAFSWIEDNSLRSRIFFVGIARATQWAYLSTVEDKEFSEMDIIREAENAGHIIVQHVSDTGLADSGIGTTENFEDDFSVL